MPTLSRLHCQTISCDSAACLMCLAMSHGLVLVHTQTLSDGNATMVEDHFSTVSPTRGVNAMPHFHWLSGTPCRIRIARVGSPSDTIQRLVVT